MINKELVRLGDVPVGQVVRLGENEFIVLEQDNGNTKLIMRYYIEYAIEFGENNDYRKSLVRNRLNEYADELASIVGKDNIIEHNVDLTSEDGIDDYGSIVERVSLLTVEQYKKYAGVIGSEEYVDESWWLATPESVEVESYIDSLFVMVVTHSGDVDLELCTSYCTVRPFCILNSNISVRIIEENEK